MKEISVFVTATKLTHPIHQWWLQVKAGKSLRFLADQDEHAVICPTFACSSLLTPFPGKRPDAPSENGGEEEEEKEGVEEEEGGEEEEEGDEEEEEDQHPREPLCVLSGGCVNLPVRHWCQSYSESSSYSL